MCLDTHTGFRVSPTADFRPLEILSGRRNVSISLATRLEAGQRETKLSYTPPKIYRSSLGLQAKLALVYWLLLPPNREGKWCCWADQVSSLSSLCAWELFEPSSPEIILTGHQISNFSTYPKSVLNVMVTWYQAVFSEYFPRTFHQHHSSLSFQWHLAKFQINTQFFSPQLVSQLQHY